MEETGEGQEGEDDKEDKDQGGEWKEAAAAAAAGAGVASPCRMRSLQQCQQPEKGCLRWRRGWSGGCEAAAGGAAGCGTDEGRNSPG